MQIVYLSAGAGRMECDACLRDGTLARALIERGHDVMVVPTYTPLHFDTERMGGSPIFYGGINLFLQQKLALFRHTPRWIDQLFDMPWLLRVAARFGDMTSARELAEMTLSVLEGEDGRQKKELDRLLDWFQHLPHPDLVLLPNSLFAGLARPVRERLGVPVLCLLSGEDLFISEFPEKYLSPVRDALRRQAEWIDAFMVTSACYADSMSEYLDVTPERIHRIVQGIECRQYPAERPPRDPGEFVIGYRSQVCPKLGLHVLAKAFRALKQRTTSLRIRLKVAGYLGAGEKQYFRGIVQLIERAGYGADFEYVGELAPEAQGAFLSSLDALAAPAIYPDQIAMQVPQALACGVPVVAARLGALPEWIESTGGGVLVDPNDPESLAEGLAGLIESPDRAGELGLAGQEAVRSRHDILHMADDVLDVARRLTTPTPCPHRAL